MNTEIYEHLLACCHRPTLGSRWSFIDVDPDSGMLNVDPPAMLVSLLNEFELDELIEAKVAVSIEADIKLNPLLSTSDKLLVVLRDSQGRPFDVVTSRGTLHKRVPLFAIARDITTEKLLLSEKRRMFLVSTMEEMILYRSLKLSSAPMKGLEHLTELGLGMLLGLVDGARGGQIRVRLLDGSVVKKERHGAICRVNANNPRLTIVLVAFNLVTGEKSIPLQVFTTAKRLAGAASYLDIQWTSLTVWWPTETDRQHLEYKRQIRGPGLVWHFLSNMKAFAEIDQFVDPSHLPGCTDPLSEVQNKLLKAQQVARFDSDSQRRQKQYREAFKEHAASIDRLLIKPMIERGEQSENLSLRALRLQLAGVSRALLISFPSLHAVMEERLTDGPSADGGFLPASAWKDIKALSDQVTKIVQAEQRVVNGK